MSDYVLLGPARADLLAIGRFIAADNPVRAVSFVRELRDTCQRLADLPMQGMACPQYRPQGVRSFVHRPYIIFYRPRPNGIDVARILHSARLRPQSL